MASLRGQCWQRMGLYESQREARREALGVHITNLLLDMPRKKLYGEFHVKECTDQKSRTGQSMSTADVVTRAGKKDSWRQMFVKIA